MTEAEKQRKTKRTKRTRINNKIESIRCECFDLKKYIERTSLLRGICFVLIQLFVSLASFVSIGMLRVAHTRFAFIRTPYAPRSRSPIGFKRFETWSVTSSSSTNVDGRAIASTHRNDKSREFRFSFFFFFLFLIQKSRAKPCSLRF